MRTFADFQQFVEEFQILREILYFLGVIYLLPLLVFATGAAVCLADFLVDRFLED